jgi:CheY-like chemotaxis protein
MDLSLPDGSGFSIFEHIRKTSDIPVIFLTAADDEGNTVKALPWSAVAISAVAVMLLTFGTMRYGKRKLRRISIVEAIRNEAI